MEGGGDMKKRKVEIFMHLCYEMLIIYFKQCRWVIEDKEIDIDMIKKSEDRMKR